MGQAAVAMVVGALAAAAKAAEGPEAEARAEVGRAAVATVVGALAAEARAGRQARTATRCRPQSAAPPCLAGYDAVPPCHQFADVRGLDLQVRHNGRTVTTGVLQGWAHGEHEGNGGTGGRRDDGRTLTAGDISLYLDLACTQTGGWSCCGTWFCERVVL